MRNRLNLIVEADKKASLNALYNTSNRLAVIHQNQIYTVLLVFIVLG